jgi:hypothetical protein
MEYVGLVERCRRDACELARQWTSEQCRQCSIELESGGNIKFTAGEPSLSSWYKSCSDLVNSRFSVNSMRHVVSLSLLGYCWPFPSFPPPPRESMSLEYK